MPYLEYDVHGWSYYAEVDRDDDCTKIWHTAKHIETGNEKTIDHSPYEGMTEESFRAHVRLGFPKRATPKDPMSASVPWRHQTIQEKANELVG